LKILNKKAILRAESKCTFNLAITLTRKISLCQGSFMPKKIVGFYA